MPNPVLLNLELLRLLVMVTLQVQSGHNRLEEYSDWPQMGGNIFGHFLSIRSLGAERGEGPGRGRSIAVGGRAGG